MKLFKKADIQYNTYELLCEMVELSRANKQRFASRNCTIYNDTITVGMNLGRQCGHTTAVMKYAEEHPGVMIVVGTLDQARGVRGKAFTVDQVERQLDRLDFRCEFKHKVIIFDACSSSAVKKITSDTCRYLEEDQIPAMVHVGTVL